MQVLLMVAVLVAAAGVAAVLWAQRGGPRWVGGVAKVTLAVSDLVVSASKRRRRGIGVRSGSTNGADLGDGSS